MKLGGEIVDIACGGEDRGGLVRRLEPRGAAGEGFLVRQAARKGGIDRLRIGPGKAEPLGQPPGGESGIGLREQAEAAGEARKAQSEQRIAALKADSELRRAKLEQAGKLIKEALGPKALA